MSAIAHNRDVGAKSTLASASSRFFTVRLLLAVGRFAEAHGWLFFEAICLGFGWGRLSTLASRHLDHDELFTFYIAQAPTLGQLLNFTHTFDLHPPLSYLLVRASFALFGVSSWSCRLPFLLAFLAAVALLYHFLSRLCSPLYGLVASLILFSVPLTYLANEARPYAMVLCFTVIVLVAWYRLVEGSNPKNDGRWLAIITTGGFCLLLSHVLGVIVYGAFFAAEAVRFWARRKRDWRLWAALAVPLVSVVAYLPLLRNRSVMLFAREYRATAPRLVSFYWESIRYLVTPLAVIALVALLWPLLKKLDGHTQAVGASAIRVPFGFLLAYLSLVPVIVTILFARTGTPFFDRYGIVWLIPLAVVPALILGYRTGQDRLAGTATALLLATVLFFNNAGKSWLVEQVASLLPASAAAKLLYVFALPPFIPVYLPPIPSRLRAELDAAPAISNLDSVAPDLPIVANTGLSFMELDRQEGAQVALRLYMLTDPEAASSIAHDTVFAHYEEVKAAFPAIRGKVEPYCAFISAHRRFLAVGAYNNPQGWLLKRLDREGAELHAIGTCSGYSEDCQIYEVKVQRDQCRHPEDVAITSSAEASVTIP